MNRTYGGVIIVLAGPFFHVPEICCTEAFGGRKLVVFRTPPGQVGGSEEFVAINLEKKTWAAFTVTM